MQGLSGPRAAGAWWSDRVLPVLGLVVVVALGAALASDLPQAVRQSVSGLILMAGGVALTTLCLIRARRTSGRRRRAWGLLGAAGVAAATSTLGLWLSIPAATGGSAGWVDLLLILAFVLGTAGALTFPGERWHGRGLLRIVLDGLIIGCSLLFVASLTLFPEIFQPGRAEVPGQLLAVLAAVFEIIVAAVTGLLAWRGYGPSRAALLLSGLAFALFAASDFAAALIEAHSPFSLGTPVDLGWLVGYALLILAVLRAGAPETATAATRPLSPVVGTALIFGVFLAATGVGVLQGRNGFSPAAIALGLVGLVAVAVRQLLLIVDNERLQADQERRVAERTQALRAITQQTTRLVDSVGEGIYGVDADGVVTFVNPAAGRLLGYRTPDLIGREAHSTFHVVWTDDPAAPPCHIAQALNSQVLTQSDECAYLRADGRQIPVEVTATPLSQDGTVQGAVVVFRDITQRREVDRMKSEFVAMVSHELRTPLTSIRGSLGLLGGGALGQLGPGASRMVDLALDSTDRLTRLVDGILDIERIESGALPMTPGVYVVSDLVRIAINQVQMMATVDEVTVRASAIEGWVHADGDRVVQVLLNLLSNAIKFSPRGGEVSVAVSVRDSSVEFSVSDAGRGVPADKLDRIFARFEQVDSSDARDKGGVGLGLSISRNLVERMGGRVWAEPNPDGGTVLRFTLPGGSVAVRPGAAPADRGSAEQPAGDPAPHPGLTAKVDGPPIVQIPVEREVGAER